MQKEKTLPKKPRKPHPGADTDPKDTEIYPEPPTHHVITCRDCNKKAEVSIKYTRTCNKCRQARFAELQTELSWQSWNDWAA